MSEEVVFREMLLPGFCLLDPHFFIFIFFSVLIFFSLIKQSYYCLVQASYVSFYVTELMCEASNSFYRTQSLLHVEHMVYF